MRLSVRGRANVLRFFGDLLGQSGLSIQVATDPVAPLILACSGLTYRPAPTPCPGCVYFSQAAKTLYPPAPRTPRRASLPVPGQSWGSQRVGKRPVEAGVMEPSMAADF